MVSSALTATGVAGVPQEYFNPNVLRLAGADKSAEHAMALLPEFEKRRTTANGYFGMKLHFNQFASVFVSKGQLHSLATVFLNSFDYFIFTYRKDKVLQAISYMQAKRSGLWNSNNAALEGQVNVELRDDDVAEVTLHMKKLIDEEMGWRHFINSAKPKAMELKYEDLAAQETSHMNLVTNFLDLPALARPPIATIKKLSNDSSLLAKQKYLIAIGAIS